MTLEDYRENETLSEMTYEILRELIARKNQADRLKRKRTATGIVLIAAVLLPAACFFFFNVRIPSSLHDLIQILRLPVIWLAGGSIAAFSYFYLKMQRETTDAEDDFDELRAQVIDRASELWPKEPDGRLRAAVMHELLHEKDINLFYK
ncbi:DUF2663 family protein [Sporolactobacillus vineae]|uniref:DUF2663 family protein n=1 Tax=Sporolactobacillus vineae TaxID=444463 RepID=UPI000288E7FE|nr:DUF2663 family protein [Sporolactobacillus vineae]